MNDIMYVMKLGVFISIGVVYNFFIVPLVLMQHSWIYDFMGTMMFIGNVPLFLYFLKVFNFFKGVI